MVPKPRGRPRIILRDESMLTGLLPFFAAFLAKARFDLDVDTDAGQAVLKRGIKVASVPFCASSQRSHGLAELLAATGTPLLEWRHERIEGVVNVDPLECMPPKVPEAQFYHVAERDGLPSLERPLNGDPLNSAAPDNVAFEVKAGAARRTGARP